jgi:BolA protein
MSLSDRLKTVLTNALTPEILIIENESAKHNVPIGSESHFKVVAVSNIFLNLSKIARQRLIFSYVSMKDENIHALSLFLYTKEEWDNKFSKAILATPPCQHNNKQN